MCYNGCFEVFWFNFSLKIGLLFTQFVLLALKNVRKIAFSAFGCAFFGLILLIAECDKRTEIDRNLNCLNHDFNKINLITLIFYLFFSFVTKRKWNKRKVFTKINFSAYALLNNIFVARYSVPLFSFLCYAGCFLLTIN